MNEVVNDYERRAANYDKRWAHYVKQSIAETLRRSKIPHHAAVLDIGCGTGTLLLSLKVSRSDVSLVGVDPSAAMLNVARSKLPDVPLLQGWVERLPVADSAYDVVFSTSNFHFWRSPTAGLSEIRRVLRPNGQLILTDWAADFHTMTTLDRYLQRTDPAHGTTYDSVTVRRILERSGFRVLSLDTYKISWWWGLMTAVATKR